MRREPHVEAERLLVDACRGGDTTGAYGELVRRHSRSVFAVCLGTLGNVHDAEDIAQETFIRGIARIAQLRDGTQFGPWIMKIARNLCIDYVRRRKRGATILAMQDRDRVVPEAAHVDLREAVTRLPEKYRLPLLLYYFDGRSSESVARTLGISTDGALTRLSRARKELRKLIDSGEVSHE
jgi:RNA polymerase sigma-70 factor (ECF subfamily)